MNEERNLKWCQWCGNDIEGPPSEVKTRKFCCVSCALEYRRDFNARARRPCPCGCGVMLNPSRKFASLQCQRKCRTTGKRIIKKNPKNQCGRYLSNRVATTPYSAKQHGGHLQGPAIGEWIPSQRVIKKIAALGFQKIATQMGITRSALAGRLSRLGLKFEKRKRERHIPGLCSVPGCKLNNTPKTKGMCCGHYARWYKYGDPLHRPRERHGKTVHPAASSEKMHY